MKKILGALICLVTLACGAVDAKAALLTDWNYDLTSVSLKNFNTDFVTTTPNGGMSFATGPYNVNLSPEGGDKGSLNFTGDNTSASSDEKDTLLSQTTTDGAGESTPATKLADLTFSYSVVSADNPNVRMNITYTIPLYTFYDAATATSYVYYNNSEVSTMGATAITHDGYKYGITGVGLFVDDRALQSIEGAEGDPNLYSGWAINEDTINNTYDEYVVGGDNNVATGAKDPIGGFKISGVFSIANTKVTPPAAPTPEPATMLLMGAGLIGLGFVARRRNSK